MYRSLIMFFVLLMVAAGLPAVAYGQDDEETKQKRQAVWEERIPAPLEGAIDPDTYVLGPWDILVLSLKGGETKTHELTVLPEGNVILPNAGTVRAAGLTLTDFRAEVRRVLKRYYRNMDIDCQLARPRTFVTYVVGEVNDPQQVTITAPFRLSQALGQVGGVTERGSLRRIQIRGEDGTLQRTVDMFLFLKRGDFEHNPVLSEGQSVYVPARSEEVQVVGEVLLPGLYELVEGETAADMIKHAGGLGPLADPEHIVIEGGHEGHTMVCDIRTADQYQLSDDYIVIVRDRRSYEMPFKDPVLVFGGGGREGWISVDKEEPLTDFLSRLWRFGPQFDIESAVLERDSTGEDPVHIEFNVRDVLSGKEHSELTVRPGDRIGFPPLEWKVYVAGDVNKPGELDFHPGFTAERYIALAGGPNDRGSFDRLTIYSADGNKRGADRNSVVYRGDTIVVNRKMSSVLGSWFVGVTALTSLVLAVYAVTQ